MVSLNRQSHIPHALVVAVLFVFLTSAFAGPRAALTWTQLQPANGFPERAGFASAYDPVSKKVIVFGGFDANGQVYSDTLTFDGKTWQQITTASAPSARFGAAMAYDSSIQKLVLFAGSAGFSLFDDTWLFDGATLQWTQVQNNHFMAPTVYAMAFTDPGNGHAVMFGGRGHQFYSRTTFRWTGTEWMIATSAGNMIGSPYPRAGGVSVLDPLRKTVVLFGGISDNWITQNTWNWNPTWVKQNPSTQPDTLYYTSGAFDPRLRRVVVFGGGSEGVDEDGTWTWTGSNWKLLSPLVSPPGREQFGTVYDEETHQFLIFGGLDFISGQFFGDTWELSTN